MTTQVVAKGKVRQGAVVANSDTLEVSSGGTADATTVNSGGTLQIDVGGTAKSTILASGGTDVVFGTDVNTTINAGGYEYVSAGGASLGATINGGTLEVANGPALGNVPITFAGPGGTLDIDGAAMPTDVISGFSIGDTIDLSDVSFSGGAVQLTQNGLLEVTENGQTYNLQLGSSQGLSSQSFSLSSDGAGGTDISLNSSFVYIPIAWNLIFPTTDYSGAVLTTSNIFKFNSNFIFGYVSVASASFGADEYGIITYDTVLLSEKHGNVSEPFGYAQFIQVPTFNSQGQISSNTITASEDGITEYTLTENFQYAQTQAGDTTTTITARLDMGADGYYDYIESGTFPDRLPINTFFYPLLNGGVDLGNATPNPEGGPSFSISNAPTVTEEGLSL